MTKSIQDLRIIFAGTPEFAAGQLASLIDAEARPVAVYTQPDRPARRGKKMLASPVKQLANGHQIPVYQPASLRDDAAREDLRALDADIMVVAAYGLLLPQAVLDIPRLGCINVHASLLPRWRGAAPVERAIEAGDNCTGVTIMQMEAGLDTGPMLVVRDCSINEQETGDSLRQKLSIIGSEALLVALRELASGEATPVVQDDTLSTYADKLQKAEAEIDWSVDGNQLQRKIRAFNSSNVSFSQLGAERVKIWRAQFQPGSENAPAGTIVQADKEALAVACGGGRMLLEQLQMPGGKALDHRAILNGHRDKFLPGNGFRLNGR